MGLKLSGAVEEAFTLAPAPEVCFRYFAQNEDLLKQFLGDDRVERLEAGVYRVKLNPHGALGLTLQPSFDVAFIEHPPAKVEMRSRGARLESASHQTEFDAQFTGEARFESHPDGTLVVCWSRMEVELALPDFLAWMPTGPLEAIGNGIIEPAMRTLARRLVPIMRRDIQRWLRAQETSGSPSAAD